MKADIREALKRLPAVDEVVRGLGSEEDAAAWPRWAVVQAVRDEIAHLRQRVLSGETETVTIEGARVRERVRELLRPSLGPVVNATGVVLHTNLGRAPLSEQVLRRIVSIASGYSNLEYQVEARRRGNRHVHAAALLRGLCGAEDAVVVNNNAGAVLLCLAAFAQGREVVVSRGELIEIGGSFRLPDVMAASGAILREVGTTNRTHPRDYEQAVGERTGLLLKAHRSNFAVVGFTREVDSQELVAIGHAHDVPTMFDLGSGCLVDLAEAGLPGELMVQQAVRSGFDLVTFSGDKLLGGPQAGLIVGRAEAVDRVRSHPLMRALRPDKMTLAGVEATLEAYRDGEAWSSLPALRMLCTPEKTLRTRAGRLRRQLEKLCPAPWSFEILRVQSRVGGGAAPQRTLGSWAVAVAHPGLGADAVEERLRRADPPIIARIDQEMLVLDVRTIDGQQLTMLARAVAAALGPAATEAVTSA